MKETNSNYHNPVMLPECLEALDINPSGIYVDVTFGGGGHSKAIFKLLDSNGKLIAVDQDPDAKKNAWEASNFHFVASNFAYFYNQLRLLGIRKVDGILADLGVSSHQFDEKSRGFSIHGNAKLDMRMNQNGDLTAAKILNTYEEGDLASLFRTYGEIKNPGKLARKVVESRLSKPFQDTSQLTDVCDLCAPKFKEHKYYAQVFQALRIEVNDELNALKGFLNQCTEALKPKGRLVIMSYHSLEDRLVKNFMKRGSFTGEIEKDFYGVVQKPFTEIIRKPITANEEEVKENTRARSAKLRIAERNG